ncbi:hypothetical protein [Nitrosopumilus maritimus]|uniref:hypothetical protein n=2 Tax=Nitrosopumilus TaxID=338191 RepID=UPI000159AF03|nr:hypothetical protein [Nitrosopumilus maritimus]
MLQISKYRGKFRDWIDMCECSKVHLYEVEFKLDGMNVVPTHKNCGYALDAKQNDKFQKELVKSWGFEEEEE